MKRRWGSLSFLVLLCIYGVAFGQNFRGSVSGVVTDPNSAVIPGAKVTLTDFATRATLSTQTDSQGQYSILYVPAGRHQLRIEAKGFQSRILENVEVRVGDQLSLDLRLEVGQTSDTITVQGDSTPLLETSSASLGLVIDRQRISDLPQPDGNPFLLARFAAGVANTDVNNLKFTRAFDNGGTSNLATNGVVGQGSEFTLDGIPNNGAFVRQVSYVPPAEAVQEFKVVTTSFDAQQGHSAGAQIDVVLRSGANRPFGSVYWFNRNEALAANEFFVNSNPNCNKDSDGKCKRNPLRYNRYGATLGGPVVLPRFGNGGRPFWSGKDRLFFFFAFEGLRQITPSTSFLTVPTQAERNGDFSALLAQGITIYDPATARPLSDGRAVERQPIQCGGRINVICPERFSQIGKNYLSYYPLPNLPGDRQGRNNLIASQPRTDYFHSESFRVDSTISEKQQFFVRYSHNRRQQHVQSFSGVVNGIDPTSIDTYRVNNGVAVDHVYRASPTTILNMRAGVTRFLNFGKWLTEGEFNPASLGFSPETAAYFGDASYFPQFTISNFATLGGPLQQFSAYDVYAFQPTLTKIKGGHTLRTGYDFRTYRINENPSRHEAGVYNFDPGSVATRQFGNSPAAAIGGELAAVLLGLPSGGSIDRVAGRSNQQLYHGLFFQDDWKVTKRLSLNLGLRWEMESPTTERYNRNVRGFDFTSPSPIEAAARTAYAANPIPQVAADAFHATGGLLFANEDNRGFSQADNNNFQPRIGLAFELTPKTVLRGGFAIYSVPFYIDDDVNQPGFSQPTQIVPTLDGGLTFQATLANPFPNGVADPPGASQGLATSLGRNITFVPLERKNTLSRRFEVSLQRELPGQVVVDLAFVRTVNYDQLVPSITLNPIPRQYLSTLDRRDPAVENFLNAMVKNPFSGLLPGTSNNGPTIQTFQLLRPYPQFGSVLVQRYDGASWYNSGQLRIERRFSQGYTLSGAYTYSKLMEAMSLLNSTDTDYERRISNNDYPHRVVISGIYELPVGKGRRFLSGGGRLLDLLVGGYQFQGIYQYQGGRPLAWDFVTYFGDPSELQTNINSNTVGTSGRAFDTSGFFSPGVDIRLGNNIRTFPSRLSGFRSQPLSQVDLSMIKNFKFTERTKMQLRLEFFNATNTPQFGAPNLTPTDSNFGKVTGQVNLPRNVQVGLRLVF
jgi:carboxypeptidase family protein